MTRMRVMKARSTDYCAELILLTSIYLLDLQRRRRYANVLNSGNEAIDKTNMRGQQTKIHYLAISKHAPSSRAISTKGKLKLPQNKHFYITSEVID